MKRETRSDSKVRRSSARLQLAVFLGVTFALSAFLQALIIVKVGSINTLLALPLMWIPGLTALATSNTFGNQFRDMAFVRPSRKTVLIAYGGPALLITLMWAICLVTDIGRFSSPTANLGKLLIVQPTIGVFMATVLALGEELGWRGFLHTHLLRARIPHPVLVTGGIWAVWHWPLILGAGYVTSDLPWLSLALFTIMAVSFSVFLGWLREKSRSVFPCAVAHGVHNTWVQGLIPAFYQPDRLSPYFAGEAGFILAILYLFLAIWLYRKSPLGRYSV